METFRTFRALLALPLVLAMLTGDNLAATSMSASRPSITDVELGRDGTLRGRVVDAQGIAKAGSDLTVWSGKKPLGKVKANEKGEFAFSGLRAGIHQVTTDKGAFVCRFWALNTAPPAAKSSIMLIDDPAATPENVAPEVIQAQFVEEESGSPLTEYSEEPPQVVGNQGGHSARRRCIPRGRCGLCWHSPLLIGGLIATAIAVPVALNGNGIGGNSGS
jgi:hypothetical protein